MAACFPAPDALAVHNPVTRIIKGGVYRYYSRFQGAAAVVIILKVEPGSILSFAAMFFT
jgi:hypothetical protein